MYQLFYQVTEVYDLVRKVEPVISTLPDIVDRMSTLKLVHEQGIETLMMKSISNFTIVYLVHDYLADSDPGPCDYAL